MLKLIAKTDESYSVNKVILTENKPILNEIQQKHYDFFNDHYFNYHLKKITLPRSILVSAQST